MPGSRWRAPDESPIPDGARAANKSESKVVNAFAAAGGKRRIWNPPPKPPQKDHQQGQGHAQAAAGAGELYTEENVSYLEEFVEGGGFVEGAADPTLQQLRVVAE